MYLRFIDQCYWLGNSVIHESKFPVDVNTTHRIGGELGFYECTDEFHSGAIGF